MLKPTVPSLVAAALLGACFSEPPPYGGVGEAESSAAASDSDPLGGTAQAFASDDSGEEESTGGASGSGTSEPPPPPQTDDSGDSDPTPDDPCGDGMLTDDEECDDGNVLAGDGCSPTCRIEVTGCADDAVAVADDPVTGIAICRDPESATCEEDFASLCAAGWHLCTAGEHAAKNDGWAVDLAGQRALGVIRCRAAGGAGHYTITTVDADGADNCQIGSSRAECPSAFGCNETLDYALCCSRIPTCGNGKLDGPLEECDDGNAIDGDDCSNACASKTGTGLDC